MQITRERIAEGQRLSREWIEAHPPETSNLLWITIRTATRTIWLRSRISRLDSESVRCEGSSQRGRRRDFYRFTAWRMAR